MGHQAGMNLGIILYNITRSLFVFGFSHITICAYVSIHCAAL